MGLLDKLKASGASDADIEAMKPLLSNELFVKAVEEDLNAVSEAKEAARQAEIARKDYEEKYGAANKSLEDYNKWYKEQAEPAFEAIRKDAVTAREEAARYREKLKAAKDYGFADLTDADLEAPKATPPVQDTPKVDLPDLSRYVTADAFAGQVKEFGDMYGRALAMATDIAEEHRDLFGTRINMSALREKAVAEGKSIDEMWRREYDVEGKRQEKARLAAEAEEKKKQEWIESIRKEEREKVLSNFGSNPQTRDPMPSKFPVFQNKDREATPWSKSGDKSLDRVGKVMTTLAKTGIA
jgi:hypothetical protein